MTERSTRAVLLDRETKQSTIIAALIEAEQDEAAHRLADCMATRIFRPATSSWRPRCRGPGCLSCWNGSLSNWWSSYRSWCSDDPATFVVVVPGDQRLATPIARAVRDDRDRQARGDPAWAEMALYGLTDGTSAHLLVSPWKVPTEAVMAVLRHRWPTLQVGNADGPGEVSSVKTRTALAIRKRGTTPLRFVVHPQRPVQSPPAETDFIPFEMSSHYFPRF